MGNMFISRQNISSLPAWKSLIPAYSQGFFGGDFSYNASQGKRRVNLVDLKTERNPSPCILLLFFLNFFFPGKVRVSSHIPGEIICGASDRSKDKEHRPCWLQWELSRHHFPKCSWCQPWFPNLLSIPTSQPQNSTKLPRKFPPRLMWGIRPGALPGKPGMLWNEAGNSKLSSPLPSLP